MVKELGFGTAYQTVVRGTKVAIKITIYAKSSEA
jgi:hypothetical protein